jgi:hypothetical protein
MSTDTILKALVDARRLFKIVPLDFAVLGLDPEDLPRKMYVSSDISAAVMPPFPETDEGERLFEFRAWLDAFVECNALSVSEDPDDKPQETMLCRVHKVEDEFWSIRVTLPEKSPGIRAFGAFIRTDEFVALTWTLREDIEIGDFDQEVKDAMTAWSDLFGSVPPHGGRVLNDYLTVCEPV